MHPPWARSFLSWHITTNSDTLMRDTPPWFVGIVWAELLLQVPFFIAALVAVVSSERMRLPTIIYGAHTATTLVPILAHFWGDASLTLQQRATLIAIYCPYLIMPLAMLWRASTRAARVGGRAKAA